MGLSDRQIDIALKALEKEYESIRTDRTERPSIRALMMADVKTVMGALIEERQSLGARSEQDHQGSEEH
jgi:hypothetical protein